MANKYNEYYYTVVKNRDGLFFWRIRDKNKAVLMLDDHGWGDKEKAGQDARKHIDEYFGTKNSGTKLQSH